MTAMDPPELARLKVTVRGAVQGVGFRPFVYRLASELGLAGWVNNSAQGVFIEIEGHRPQLEEFLLRIEAERPPRSFIQSLEPAWLDPVGYRQFEIRQSESGGAKTALVLPDIATCPDCLREIFDSANRRYSYPFTNCTNCGPRFSIIKALPYDRPNTSMDHFTLCPQCQAEYEDPRDRRFHAQPNACPVCGPHLELWDRTGQVLIGNGHDALRAADDAIREGQIVAVKGLGGFHLMVAAHNDQAVRRLRELKHREEKPFALMFPSLELVRAQCEVSPIEERLLRSPEAPIALLRRLPHVPIAHRPSPIANSVAPGHPCLGVMLPYTPLHHLLMASLGLPVVATSGNLSDEPICTDEHEALERLGGIAHLFLVHNRPILRHVDDSIARVVLGRELVLRRARGYAPLPIQLNPAGTDARTLTSISDFGFRISDFKNEPGHAGRCDPTVSTPAILAVGAHLKNSVALAIGRQVFLSQHIGDLETVAAFAAFRRVIADFDRLYQARPAVVAADAHPDYLSTRFARELAAREGSRPCVSIQHHYAHVVSCMAENELEPPALGVSWDGTGYGLDGTIWGGEFLSVTAASFERAGHLRTFRLPGGDQAVREPRRAALGVLYEMFGEGAFAMKELAPIRSFAPADLKTLQTMLQGNLNTPATSSAGRLFDAVAALIGLRQVTRYEGQAAMELEFALDGVETEETYPLRIADCGLRIGFACSGRGKGAADSDCGLRLPVPEGERARPTAIAEMNPNAGHSSLASHHASPGTDHASRITHHTPLVLDWSPMIREILADLKRGVSVGEVSARFHNALVEGILAVARCADEKRVVLTGGCFQNKYLLERAVLRLQAAGFRPYWHQRVPPNDGGIALGQAVAARRACATET